MAALILTAFVLFVAGGCIALLGDRLGTYVGKKRISKFGLRPRETAKLYTFFSGAIIALLVLILLMVLNHQYLQAVSDRAALKKDIAAQHRVNAALEGQIRKASAEIAAATARVTRANQDLRFAEVKKGAAERALRAAKASLLRMQGRLSANETKLAASQAAVAARQRDLSRAQSQLETTNGRLRATMTNLNATVDDLGRVRAQAKQEVAAANGRVQSLKADGKVLTQRNQALRADYLALTAANQKIADANNALVKNSETLASQPLIYRRGGELGRTTIDAGQSQGEIRAALSTWLDGLDRRAYDAGAGRGPEGGTIVLVNPPSQDAHAVPVSSTRAAILDAIVGSISDQRRLHPSVAVVAEAKYNTAAGDQVRVDLRPYNNVLVFRAGHVIASATIDGTKDETTIKQSLYNFLTNSVRRRAVDAGVIAEHDPITGSVSATVWDITKLGDTIKDIQAAGAGSRVDAIAVSDTYSVQPASLRLTVSPDAKISGPPASTTAAP